MAETRNMDKLIDKFKRDGGISLDEYHEDEFIGMERMTCLMVWKSFTKWTDYFSTKSWEKDWERN